MAFHGKPRYTGDLDIYVRPSPENAGKLDAALRRFGAPISMVSLDDWIVVGTTVSLGIPPRRIDILNWLSGLDWESASVDAVSGELGSVSVKYLSLRAWRVKKAAANRQQDQEDLGKLK